MLKLSRELGDEDALLCFGQTLAGCLSPGVVIELRGELGAGKTTLSRAIIQSFGHEGAVKSPTYTLVEPYEHLQPPVYHFDLYRIADPGELNFLGVDLYFNERSICLIEWPERAAGSLPPADLVVTLEYATPGRTIGLRALSKRGEVVLECLS